jgi:hypothetical protein
MPLSTVVISFHVVARLGSDETGLGGAKEEFGEVMLPERREIIVYEDGERL